MFIGNPFESRESVAGKMPKNIESDFKPIVKKYSLLGMSQMHHPNGYDHIKTEESLSTLQQQKRMKITHQLQ